MLRTEDLVLAGVGDGRNVLDGITLTIHAGEVLGIAGVEGNGQAELVEVIMGMREPTSGLVFLGDTDISDWRTREIREAGVAYIPEDRHRHGLLLEAPLWENRILGHQTEEPNAKGFLINAAGAKADTERIVKEYDVRTPSIFVKAGSLSGGNQQKLIVGREMSHEPKVLVASHPTRGVDVGAQVEHLGHHPQGPSRRPRRAAHLGRPRGADRPVRHHRGHPPRPAHGHLRPRHGDRRGPRRGHDRRRRHRSARRRDLDGTPAVDTRPLTRRPLTSGR